MSANYRTFFGMKREAFPRDISLKEILETQDIDAIKERFDYTVRLGAIATVTGEIGSGKSTGSEVCRRKAPSVGIPTRLDHRLLRLHTGVLPAVSR